MKYYAFSEDIFIKLIFLSAPISSCFVNVVWMKNCDIKLFYIIRKTKQLEDEIIYSVSSSRITSALISQDDLEIEITMLKWQFCPLLKHISFSMGCSSIQFFYLSKATNTIYSQYKNSYDWPLIALWLNKITSLISEIKVYSFILSISFYSLV